VTSSSIYCHLMRVPW